MNQNDVDYWKFNGILDDALLFLIFFSFFFYNENKYSSQIINIVPFEIFLVMSIMFPGMNKSLTRGAGSNSDFSDLTRFE